MWIISSIQLNLVTTLSPLIFSLRNVWVNVFLQKPYFSGALSIPLPHIIYSLEPEASGGSLKTVSKRSPPAPPCAGSSVLEQCPWAPAVDHGCCTRSRGRPLYAGEKLLITCQTWERSKQWGALRWCCSCFHVVAAFYLRTVVKISSLYIYIYLAFSGEEKDHRCLWRSLDNPGDNVFSDAIEQCRYSAVRFKLSLFS